ncbi:cation diffusion facilitator family transporter [Pseudomonas sp. L-22-4S-12]|uniref:cation diffusion facilitator family transporter n=1 Tax=Pseudomonas sp. L-22-4S-12 TaxID=2610893 RepID=UPI001324EE80|nr:cation diffusion facilitator family transporter [Pseudomonas sp. L-22-4S-12]MWV15485.1 cation diffusion facilitator family transporter [Pseudomonas sp. L-22-4S-12]
MRIDPQHARLLRLATGTALAVALLLALAKAVAWWLSGSVSLLAGLTDSLLDGAASLLNLIAVNYALRPADADHRYGHGKAEALAGLGQALFIGLSAGLVGVHGVERFLNPQPLSTPTLGVLVMLVSLLLTGALLAFQHRVVRITGSTAIRADSLHYRSDLLLNGSILLALVLASFGWSQVDALFGIAIAFFILWSAVGIAREACAVLMDQELAAELSERMLLLACGVDGVVGAHDLRTRRSGMHWFVQLHVEIPGELSLQQAHELCEQVENAIRGEFAQAEVLVHADPLDVVRR